VVFKDNMPDIFGGSLPTQGNRVSQIRVIRDLSSRIESRSPVHRSTWPSLLEFSLH